MPFTKRVDIGFIKITSTLMRADTTSYLKLSRVRFMFIYQALIKAPQPGLMDCPKMQMVEHYLSLHLLRDHYFHQKHCLHLSQIGFHFPVQTELHYLLN